MEERKEFKTLLDAPEGSEVRIKRILGGRGIKCRLEGLGIFPGQTVKVLKNGWGPVLIEVFGRKIGLGRGQAAKILVE
jgi:ferrous iron transport protein A